MWFEKSKKRWVDSRRVRINGTSKRVKGFGKTKRRARECLNWKLKNVHGLPPAYPKFRCVAPAKQHRPRTKIKVKQESFCCYRCKGRTKNTDGLCSGCLLSLTPTLDIM